MSFWGTVGKMAGQGLEKGLDKIRETGEEVDKKTREYSSYSDDRLISRAKHGDMKEKMAARRNLEERGYKRRED